MVAYHAWRLLYVAIIMVLHGCWYAPLACPRMVHNAPCAMYHAPCTLSSCCHASLHAPARAPCWEAATLPPPYVPPITFTRPTTFTRPYHARMLPSHATLLFGPALALLRACQHHVVLTYMPLAPVRMYCRPRGRVLRLAGGLQPVPLHRRWYRLWHGLLPAGAAV